jgi:hypothetical protein
LFADVRVVVWITTEHHLTRFKPMPAPVLKALEATTPPSDTSPVAGTPSSP